MKMRVVVAALAVMSQMAVAESDVFPIYTDSHQPTNHYIPSGWMGDYGDLKLDQDWKDNPHSGKTSIKWTYSAAATQGASWAGAYWQHPANNWGNKPGGFDLRGYSKLTFWARGEKGGEVINEFKVGGITGEVMDSDSAAIGPIELTKAWKQYTIDLSGKDLQKIIGGFCWATGRDVNPDGFVIYFDDIQFER